MLNSTEARARAEALFKKPAEPEPPSEPSVRRRRIVAAATTAATIKAEVELKPVESMAAKLVLPARRKGQIPEPAAASTPTPVAARKPRPPAAKPVRAAVPRPAREATPSSSMRAAPSTTPAYRHAWRATTDPAGSMVLVAVDLAEAAAQARQRLPTGSRLMTIKLLPELL